MQLIPRERATQILFDRRIPPALRVNPGESFLVQTEDAYHGLIRSADRLPIPEHVWVHVPSGNPVAGPIFVEGAKKGDVIAVRIDNIEVDEQGVACFEPDLGPLRDSKRWPECSGPYTRIISHLKGPSGTTRDGFGVFSDKVRWKLAPMIGTIGVAPEWDVTPSVSTQGPWGGNIDCRDIKEGTTLYLNCYNDGGLLFVGDVHATQADTELTGVADETRANITMRLDVIKGKRLNNPRLEKAESIIALCSSRPLENAVAAAMLDLMEWMVTEYGIDQKDAYMQLSVNPDVRVHVYQMVLSPMSFLNYTAGVEIPKRYLTVV